MNLEERINKVGEGYRAQGYEVVVHPGPDVLPPFAKDFKVEILATRPGLNVLASAKGSPTEVEEDPNLVRYAEVIEKQPGWRYDLFVLGPDPRMGPEPRDAKEPTEEEVRRSLDEAERLLAAGFVLLSVLAAWAALESAMRRRLQALGEKVGWADSGQTLLSELFSAGVLSNRLFRELEGLFRLRSLIVHGFSAPAVEPNSVKFLIETARRLLDESRPAKQRA